MKIKAQMYKENNYPERYMYQKKLAGYAEYLLYQKKLAGYAEYLLAGNEKTLISCIIYLQQLGPWKHNGVCGTVCTRVCVHACVVS